MKHNSNENTKIVKITNEIIMNELELGITSVHKISKGLDVNQNKIEYYQT